ncbi:MAG: sulfite exporter TauE/SafE family protein [Anaerolineae bacterium]|nr:sulfite exporter TauE/SafE family protein [Anaerolineae bacterium]
MSPVLVAVIIFFAVFTQSVAGFGLPLIAMALLIQGLGVEVATPLVALVTFSAGVVLLYRYRAALKPRLLVQIIGASLVGIPLGVWLLQTADQQLVLTLLGIGVVIYALYALSNLKLPEIQHPIWAYGIGFVAGILSGAYNLGGPVVVVYGSCRRWVGAEFKSTMQGFFVVSSLIVIAAYAITGSYTPVVWENFLYCLPAIALGLGAGLSMDRFMNPVMFRRIVLVLLIALGLNLIF